MSSRAENDTLEINPSHLLDEIIEPPNAVEDMLRCTEKGNPTTASSAPPRNINVRSLDQFLEDAYREQSMCHQWKYWLIMVRVIR